MKIELKVKTDKHKVQFQAVLRQQGSLWQKASLKQVSFRSRMKVKIRQIAIVKWLQCCKVDILEKGDGCNAGVSLGCSLEVCIGRHFRAWSSPAWVDFGPAQSGDVMFQELGGYSLGVWENSISQKRRCLTKTLQNAHVQQNARL